MKIIKKFYTKEKESAEDKVVWVDKETKIASSIIEGDFEELNTAGCLTLGGGFRLCYNPETESLEFIYVGSE